MGFEIVDRRKQNQEEEPVSPTVLEIVQDREKRCSDALAAGDLAGANTVAAECKNPPTTYGDVVPFKKTVVGEKQEWKSVGYVAVFLPMGKAQVLMVRAAGIRTDELMFIADYAIPPVWVEGEDFTAEAQKRLNTFKACSCDRRGKCKFHGEKLPGPDGPGEWLKADMERLARIQGSQLPEAVEVLMKAEAARQQNKIIVPGRG
jgi:hypothetical protein